MKKSNCWIIQQNGGHLISTIVYRDSKKKIYRYKEKPRVREKKKGYTGFKYGILRVPICFVANYLQWNR